jgi:hypothetical protein
MAMEAKTDGSHQRYVDIPSHGGEHIRLTFISGEKAGYQRDSLRIQIRAADGHLRQGPEIPLDILIQVLGAAGVLVSELPQQGDGK